jgi:signal transduction histidine kinase
MEHLGHPALGVVPCAAGAGVIVVGVLVLVGWVAGAPVLTSVVPGLVPMNPATAVAFVLAGLSLLCLRRPGAAASWQRLGRVAALIVVALALLRLGGYVGGRDVGIDTLLFHDRLLAVPYGPNRMAPNTALCLLLIGGALALLDVRLGRGAYPTQSLAMLTGVFGLITVSGYAYGEPGLAQVRPYLPMALNTAAAFLALAAGVVAARPAQGFMALLTTERPAGALCRRLLGATVATLLLLGWLCFRGFEAGFYDAGLAFAGFAVVSVGILCAISWRIAVSLDETDCERMRAFDVLAAQRVALEAANQDLEAFSYSVSHDLRAPLRAIDGFARILEEDHAAGLDAEGRRVLKVIRDNVTQMGRLIDDLLALGRTGRKELETTTIDMTALVAEVIAEIRCEEPLHPIRVRVAALAPAAGDPGMVRQVLANLLRNAWKFTRGRAEPAVEVTCVPNGTEVTYAVRDNGAGFDMAHADKLFGIFQRLHRTDEFEGNGIGLALVRRIVERHGGRVWAEAAPDRGAAFYFTLPRGG